MRWTALLPGGLIAGNVTMIGLDIAKSAFQVHGVDAVGEVVIRRKLTRGRVLGFFESLPQCLVGIEARSSSHYRANYLLSMLVDAEARNGKRTFPARFWLAQIKLARLIVDGSDLAPPADRYPP